jgi:hypothetical protein
MRTSRRELSRKETQESAEETLRVIASLPAPDGLVERVQTKLRTAPRSGSMLSWPVALAPIGWSYGNAMRGAAAAAIVCVVAGGGWRIYTRVQPGPSAKIVVMPTPAGPVRGFSIGGSVHTPDPVRAPVLTHQLTPGSTEVGTGQPGKAAQLRKPGKVTKAVPAKPAGSAQ